MSRPVIVKWDNIWLAVDILLCKSLFHIASSAHGQGEVNPVFWLATWAGTMGPPFPARDSPAFTIGSRVKQAILDSYRSEIFCYTMNPLMIKPREYKLSWPSLYTTHKLSHPPCCLGNFADYGRQVHEGDRDTRSQSQNEEGSPLLSFQGTSVRFRHNLPRWSISEGLIGWCLSVIMKFTYSFFCW